MKIITYIPFLFLFACTNLTKINNTTIFDKEEVSSYIHNQDTIYWVSFDTSRKNQWIIFYDSLQTRKAFQGKFIDGEEQGKIRTWHQNGKPRSIDHYIQGSCKSAKGWYANGNKQYKLHWSDYHMIGKNIWWYSNGHVEQISVFKAVSDPYALSRKISINYWPNGNIKMLTRFDRADTIHIIDKVYIDSLFGSAEFRTFQYVLNANSQFFYDTNGIQISKEEYVKLQTD